jgi:hypothetical protein
LGHLLFYQSYAHDLGEVSVGRWREIQRLLPPFVDYLNSAMEEKWPAGTRRNVTVFADDTVVPPETRSNERPCVGQFILAGVIRDESDGQNEIYVEDADELIRMFDWYDFLVARDGAAQLYMPLVEAIRSCTRGIEAYASTGDA